MNEDKYLKETFELLFQDNLTCAGKRMLKDYITNLQEENQKLVKVIDTILDFNFFKEECPLNFGFKDEKESKSLDVFYEDEWCETNCNDEYKKCWLKYFNKLTELKGGSDEKVENEE